MAYDFDKQVTARFYEAHDLLLQKHKDYGPKNIANAPGGPLVGLAVRLHDKLARLAHLTRTGAEMPKNESIRDTFLDIANYGIIGLLVLDGDWPGVPVEHAEVHAPVQQGKTLRSPYTGGIFSGGIAKDGWVMT